MRPVDFQPAVVQAPNTERVQQQQQSQPQISQQAFATQMEKTAEQRVHQVRETGEGHEIRPAEDPAENKEGKPRHRGRRRQAAPGQVSGQAAENPDDVPPPSSGSHVDVRV